MTEYYKEKTCPVCGKTFCPSRFGEWGWLTPRGKPVCSYTCQRESERNPKSISKPPKKQKAYRIIETGEIFLNAAECAAHLNTNKTSIYNSLNHKEGRFKDIHLERVII